MFKEFNLSSISLDALRRLIVLHFNFDIDASSVQGDLINLVTLDTGDHISFKTKVKDQDIFLLLDEWPQPETSYQIIVEKEIKNIVGIMLKASVRRKIRFASEISVKPAIKTPYNFQKLDELEFEWGVKEKIADDQFYYLEIARENSFYNVVYSGDFYDTKIQPCLPDLKAGQYYVRVRIQKEDQFGPWSKVVTFIYKNVCECDAPEGEVPSADAEMPGAWDDLFDQGGNATQPEGTPADDDIEIEEDLELITYPENGETPTEFIFEFNKDIDASFGEVIVIRRDF